MKRRYNIILSLLAGSLLWLAPEIVSAEDYTEYKSTDTRTLQFQLFFDDDVFGYEVEPDSRFVFDRNDVRVEGQSLTADGRVLADADGFLLGTRYPFEEVTDITIKRKNGKTVLSFYTRPDSDLRYGGRHRGNIINPYEDVTVNDTEFIRGTIFSISGDVEVYGEVNREVITLFGALFVGPDAVVRGDAVAMDGRIDLARDASVYGDVISGRDSRFGRRHRYSRFRNDYEEYLDIDSRFITYNRVDGLSLGLQATFSDPDSLLPTAWAGGAYAFESERWRYVIGIEQTLLRKPSISIGGEAFRLLESDDRWMIDYPENTIFALTVRDDYLDYYESEGARTFIKSSPMKHLDLEFGYRYEETKWLEAERDLWGIFGNQFDSNFSTVSESNRTAGIAAIDTGTISSLYTDLKYETINEDDPYFRSGWSARALGQWSSPDLESSFDYRRYRFDLARYQRVNHRTMLILKAAWGGSDGDLPMHRRFYLGGVGSLYGYNQKEFSGNYFWMANAEYRFNFPHSDMAASVMWDVGQAAETSDFADSEVKHSLGIAFYLGKAFKFGLAKRLDGVGDDKPELFARIGFRM